MEKPKMNTSQLLVTCLENEGVKYIFGIPGEENIAFIHELKNSSIKFITTRHEQGAAFMADVYGRLTGKPGVCLSTLGPGATNLITGVADANLDGAPLVAITGQVGTDRMHLESHQYLDLVSMFAPLTKWNRQIVRPDTTSEIVRKAFKTAAAEKPGAVHIDLPQNIASMDVYDTPLPNMVHEKSFASCTDIEKAADVISKAKRPVILAGNGAIRSKSSSAVLYMSQKLNIPVINTFMGKGIVPYTYPLSMWTIGLNQRDYANRIIEKADLVIAVGYDLIEYAPNKWNPERTIKIVHIGPERAEINKCYMPICEVIGDISDSLFEISRRSVLHEDPSYAFELKKRMIDEYNLYANDESYPMKPQKILMDLRSVMDQDDIVISDVGAHKMWVARSYNCIKPNTCIISNGFASMGISIPGAIAAKLVNPDKKVIAVTGDGGFMMNSQEIETALRIGTAFVILIFDDKNYGLIKWEQEERYGESEFVNFNNPDFVKYAEAMGIKGYRISSADELIPTLKEAFLQSVPVIIDCPVDYSENMKLSSQLENTEL